MRNKYTTYQEQLLTEELEIRDFKREERERLLNESLEKLYKAMKKSNLELNNDLYIIEENILEILNKY